MIVADRINATNVASNAAVMTDAWAIVWSSTNVGEFFFCFDLSISHAWQHKFMFLLVCFFLSLRTDQIVLEMINVLTNAVQKSHTNRCTIDVVDVLHFGMNQFCPTVSRANRFITFKCLEILVWMTLFQMKIYFVCTMNQIWSSIRVEYRDVFV